jgi:hypothetical protein
MRQVSSVEVAKAHVRQNFREDVNGAVEFLGTEFADMYPEATFLGRRSRFISAAGEQERDSQRQRTGNGDQPQTQPDGDVTDIQRDFSTQEMTALRRAGQRYMFHERREPGSGNYFSGDRSYSSYNSGNSRGGRGRGGRGRGRGRGGGRFVGAIDTAHTTDDPSVITEQTGAAGTDQTTNNGNRGATNGTHFGAGRHSVVRAVDSPVRNVVRNDTNPVCPAVHLYDE